MSRQPTKPPQRARMANYSRSRVSVTQVVESEKKVEKQSQRRSTSVSPRPARDIKESRVNPKRRTKKVEPVRVKSKPAKTRKTGRWSFLPNLILISLTTLALLYLIAQTIWSFFLPSYFKLTENTNLLLVGESQSAELGQSKDRLFFVHLEPEAKKVNVVAIDPHTQVNLVGGYNNYEIRSVYPLLAMEKKDQQFLTAAYSFALSEVVDRVLVNSSVVKKSGEITRRQDLQRSIMALIMREWQENKTLDRQLLATYFFLNTGVSWRTSKLDQDSWNSFHQQDFSKSSNRDCSVVVINSTATSGLANRIATVLERNGYLVTRTGNFPEQLPRTTIYYNDTAKACMELVSRSIKVFPLEPIVEENKVLPQRHRAGVVVIAGEDLN